MSSTGSDWLAFGVLRRPHGIKGEIFLHPYNNSGEGTEDPELPSRVRLGQAGRAGEGRDVDIAGCRPVREGYLVCFEGIVDRDAAGALVGQELFLPRDCFAPLAADEFFVDDLVGCEVFHCDGRKLGSVSGTFWNGAQDVMVCAGEDGAERMFPVVAEYVLSVDREQRRLVVDPHE